MTNEQIISLLRDVYGLKEAVYPTANLTLLITQAIKKLSIYFPEVVLTYTTTVKDQTRYTVTHTSLIKVKEVYWGHNENYTDMFCDPEIPELIVADDVASYLPSLQYANMQQIEMLRTLNPKAADIVDYNSFDLIPTPDVAGDKVYYEYDKFRTITNTPDMFEDDIALMVVWYLGQKQYISESSTQGGNNYQFDRRGNVQKNASIASSMYKQRQDEYNDIIKGVQKKLMGIK